MKTKMVKYKNIKKQIQETGKRNRIQISLLILNQFELLSNFHSLWNDKKTYGFLMISGEIELN